MSKGVIGNAGYVCIRFMQEKCLREGRKLYVGFINLRKAYNKGGQEDYIWCPENAVWKHDIVG